MKTRFCPSPTGFLHIGNMRTALFNALMALHHEGAFLLRVEDTDKTRSEAQYVDAVMQDLKWLSLDWQDGPYWQSERQTIYNEYYAQLLEMGKAYHCFCTEEQLALNRKVMRAQGLPPRYPGTCRNLSPQEIEEKLSRGTPATLRFHIPETGTIEFEDLVKGQQKFACADLGDFIIRRADGTASFMYCNAIDDALMGVTCALRGEDHLTNTPRQLLILESLQLTPPQYGHISLITGSDGAPLSKRNGSASIQDLRTAGYLPMAIINYIARLGHYYGHDNYLSLQALADSFAAEHLASSPARFDMAQLNRWQHEVLLQLTIDELAHWLSEYIDLKMPKDQQFEFLQLIQPNIAFPKDVQLWYDALFNERLDYTRENKHILETAGVTFFETALEAVAAHDTDFKAISIQVKNTLDVKGKQLFLPLRVALTGFEHGPEMAGLCQLMGADRIKARLEHAIFKI